jgi:beta-fructofuranosidase
VSTQGGVFSITGRYSKKTFESEHHARADWGNVYYAAKSFADGHGRRILWGWIREARSEAEQLAAGWAGVMSLPRIVRLDGNRNLCMEPAPELQVLREHLSSVENQLVAGSQPLPAIRHDCLEIEADLVPRNAEAFGISIRRSLNSEEVEIFAGRKICLTRRIYPKRPDSLGAGLFARGGQAVVKKMDIYAPKSIWR